MVTRRRILLGLLAPLAAVGIYVALYHLVPGFAAGTRSLFGLVPEPAPSKVIRSGGRTFLWGGDDPAWAFDVTERDIDLTRLEYGLGREHFPALIEPRFVPARDVAWVPAQGKVLAVRDGPQVKLYPTSVLKTHEVVNDTVNGVPVFVAYCVLADLGAVYDRRIGNRALTFAVSGYTYADPAVWGGYQAFVLWDRETESLWWPPLGCAVTGDLRGAALPLLDHDAWSQTTWAQALAAHPDAIVLDRFQRQTPPATWPRLAPEEIGDLPTRPAGPPPAWGDNADLTPPTGRPGAPQG